MGPVRRTTQKVDNARLNQEIPLGRKAHNVMGVQGYIIYLLQ